MIRTVTVWVGDLQEHPGALVLARHRLAIDTEAAYEAMRSRTWRPLPASAVPRPRPAPEAWWAAARRLHSGADVRYVRIASDSGGTYAYVQISDNWLYCYIPQEAP